jgi:hypothetical protein
LVLLKNLTLIPRVFPIVIIGETSCGRAISVAASKLIQNIDFDFVIISLQKSASGIPTGKHLITMQIRTRLKGLFLHGLGKIACVNKRQQAAKNLNGDFFTSTKVLPQRWIAAVLKEEIYSLAHERIIVYCYRV